MRCEKCGDNLRDDVVYSFMDKKVCDDCYIDLMIGVPEVDIATLPPEFQHAARRLKKGWNRNRPNRHHYLSFD